MIVTSGAGADTIVYQYLPWNNTGHVTDFTLGTDRLDFSALFTASGYSGSNPVADGYMRFDSDGAGGTRVYYDPDGTGTGNPWPFLVTTLDHVSPQGLTAVQLFSPTTPPPASRERTDLTDGGYVEHWQETVGGMRTFHVQKYNAAGSPLGAEYTHSGEAHLAALSDGGYVVVYDQARSHDSWIEATLFDAAGAVEKNSWFVSPMTTDQIDIAASPLGGFLVTTRNDNSLAGPEATRGFVTLFDNSGTQICRRSSPERSPPSMFFPAGHTGSRGRTPERAGASTSIRAIHPTSLPATPDTFIVDDVAPVTGTISLNPGWTNDTSIALRVTVTERGELDVWSAPAWHTERPTSPSPSPRTT